MPFRFKVLRARSAEHDSSPTNHDGHKLLPVSLYLKIFGILLALIFVNIGISRLPLPAEWITVSMIGVSFVQTVLVILFFMELVHEDKFYLFVFGSAVLFMILFFTITLFELNGRGSFDSAEGIKYMRGVDLNGNYAPAGPKISQPAEGEAKKD